MILFEGTPFHFPSQRDGRVTYQCGFPSTKLLGAEPFDPVSILTQRLLRIWASCCGYPEGGFKGWRSPLRQTHDVCQGSTSLPGSSGFVQPLVSKKGVRPQICSLQRGVPGKGKQQKKLAEKGATKCCTASFRLLQAVLDELWRNGIQAARSKRKRATALDLKGPA